MLSCREFYESSNDYVDQTLPLTRRMAIRYHLFRCGDCLRYLNQLRTTINSLKRIPAAKDITDEEVESILTKIKAHR